MDTKELTAQTELIKQLEGTIKAYDNRVAELVQTVAELKLENEHLRNEKEDIITEKELLKLEKDEVHKTIFVLLYISVHKQRVFGTFPKSKLHGLAYIYKLAI